MSKKLWSVFTDDMDQEKISEIFLESRGYRVGTPCRSAERNLFMQKIIYHELLKAMVSRCFPWCREKGVLNEFRTENNYIHRGCGDGWKTTQRFNERY